MSVAGHCTIVKCQWVIDGFGYSSGVPYPGRPPFRGKHLANFSEAGQRMPLSLSTECTQVQITICLHVGPLCLESFSFLKQLRSSGIWSQVPMGEALGSLG